jgi:hypothetical protein
VTVVCKKHWKVEGFVNNLFLKTLEEPFFEDLESSKNG